jgi:hypothetical protein
MRVQGRERRGKGRAGGCKSHAVGGTAGAVPQLAERLRRCGGLDVDGVAMGVQWLAGARVWQGKL